MNAPRTIVIVGAGQAGAVAALALRDLGFDGRLLLVGREWHRPYERPPLSKAVLCSEAPPRIDVFPDDALVTRRIEWRAGIAARSLDPAGRRLTLSDGSTLDFDRCLLATGGEARRLPTLPASDTVRYLRTLDDATALRQRLTPGARVVVVGGGFLGLELASSARERGAQVDVVEGAARLLDRFVPPAVSDWLADRARQAGIRLHLGAAIDRAPGPAGGNAALALRLPDGDPLAADLVIVAVGLVPSTELARSAGLAIEPANGGIRVDARCMTSADGIFAAGDCASQLRPFAVAGTSEGLPLRIESWQNANEQGRCAAAGMLGVAPPAPAYPWFWTDQLGVNLQMLGLPAPDLGYTLRGDPAAVAPKAVWLGLRDGVPVHGIAVNAGTDLRMLRVLFERKCRIDPARFRDPATVLRTWVKSITC